MRITETTFEARAPGQCHVTRDTLEDVLRATVNWKDREFFVTHRLGGVFDGCRWDMPPIDSAAWTGRERDEIGKGLRAEQARHKLLGQMADAAGSIALDLLRMGFATAQEEADRLRATILRLANQPTSTADLDQRDKMAGEPKSDRDSVLQHLTDVARKLDALRYGAFAEDVRRIRNAIKRNGENEQTWNYTFPTGFTLANLTKLQLADIEAGIDLAVDKRVREAILGKPVMNDDPWVKKAKVFFLEMAHSGEVPDTPKEPCLLEAAETVLAGLNARIDHARETKTPAPVFHGIAELHTAIARARGRIE